jgi:hypothetical protein
MHRSPRYGSWPIRTAGVLYLLLGALRVSTASPSLILPTLFDSSDLLQSSVAGPGAPSALKLEGGAMGTATNNVGSIWVVGDTKQPAHDYGSSSAYAVLQDSRWLRLSHGGWSLSYGSGKRSAYAGNADAAQLWIDMHAEGRTQSAYAPEANSVRVTASWYAVGRDFPIRAGNLSGVGNLSLRRVIASDYLARSLVGEVGPTGMFTAMMRSVSAESAGGKIGGDGWAVDGQLRLRCGDRWLGQVTVEGLLGQVSWNGLIVDDSRIVSPRTFTDPQGFLHDCGGISGATWTESRTARLNPYYRLDLIRTGRPNILCGIAFQSGSRSTPNLGFAWPQRKKWLPYTRYYPVQRRFEIGAVGPGWQLRISGDDWIYASPQHAEVAVSAQALRF